MTLSKKWKLKTSLRGRFATAAISSLLLLAACDDDSSTSPVTPSNNEQSGSSSSSVSLSDSDGSSSSKVPEPAEGASSSSSVEQNCSALLEEKIGWNWDVPKECRLNPDITYGTMTDSRDGQTYKIVKIGDQTWMAENLNYSDGVKTPSLLERSWCYNNVARCDVLGRLYTWAAAIDSVALYDDGNGVDCGYNKTCTLPAKVQGICPDGWHLPTNTEWNILFTEVGGKSAAGKILKSQTGWDNNDNGTDGVGFSALPAGYRYDYGYFYNVGHDAYFWSATEGSSYHAHRMSLFYEDAGLDDVSKYYGFSVRCLKD